jgi:hypothetical protein
VPVTRFVYLGTAYRQATDANAPWLVSFVATAEELLSWCGIPRRSEQNQAGFQRLDSPARVLRAKEFFEQSSNQSPTALIVGLHAGDQTSQIARIEFQDDNETATLRPCKVIVECEDLTATEAAEIVKRQIQGRLDAGIASPSFESAEGQEAAMNDEEAAALEEELLEEERAADESSNDDTDESEEANGSQDEIELGHSVLRQLRQNIDDPTWLKEPENAQAIIDLAKPGTIIDGQHRILGAVACERNIPFTVVALADCPWPEQVFQFTVVNYTAKGIPDQFITANAGLSLTTPELDQLKTRLVQARVKVIEYDLMKIVNFDSESPFYNLVNLTDQRNNELIGYKTMVQVAKLWYDARHQVFSMILPNLYPEVKGRGAKTERIRRWRDDDWGKFFLAFWQVINERFADEPSDEPGEKLWSVGHSQLMVAIVLLELERAFLENLNQQDEEYFEVVPSQADHIDSMVSKIRARAQKFAAFFPPEFFAAKWGVSSLNTGIGRKELKACLESHVSKKGKYQWQDARLVTGNVTE